MKEGNSLRYSTLGILISILPVLISLRLIWIQFDKNLLDSYRQTLGLALSASQKVEPQRGMLLDRKGQPLASNQRTYEIGIDLVQLKDPHAVALTLNLVTGRPLRDIEEDILWAQEEKYKYIVVDDFVPQEKIDQLQMWIDRAEASNDLKESVSLNGIYPRKHLKRTYPNKELMANVLGFVGWTQDREEPTGILGVEAYYNDLLANKVQNRRIQINPNEAHDYNILPDGADLVLTLDREIQSMAEDVLDKSLNQNGAEAGTILIMDPRTGEILAMATTPRLDPNRYWEFRNLYPQDVPYNSAISKPIEPGSVFKVLTVAAALDSGAITTDFNYVDTGVLEYAGVNIYNWNRGGWGPQDLLGCLQHSLNVCLSTLSTKYMGNEIFYRYMNAFGIGHQTGVDLAGEVSGSLKSPGVGYWHESDLATNAFGQGLTTTALQMVMSVSAIANDGKMMVPHVVKSIAQQGYQTDLEQRIAGYPIRPETAHMVSDLMARSLEVEASDALVPGYRVSGKTGTAQIPTAGGYHPYLTNASFIGFGPTDDPQFIVYILFEKPTSSPWGSEVAAPVFSELVQRLVVLMDIPPDDIRHTLASK
jgi:cell division protein FtsI/penicillin-binding protein 2